MSKTTEEMEREVYEFFTGKCWHEGKYIGPCRKCGKFTVNPNPPLATSLDAWRPIWEAMTDEQTKQVDSIIYELVLHGDIKAMWQATAMHHLEAAMKVVKGE